MITSHYNLLKQFGLTNPNVTSVSFIFNEEKIEPTFRIIYDVTGKSYGFKIARKYGLNDTVVSDAEKIYEQNYIDDNDRKLQILEDKERYIHEKNEQLNKRKRELDQLNSELIKKNDALKLKEEKLKEKKIDDFDEYMNSKIDEIDDIVEEFKTSNKTKSKEYIDRINSLSLTKKVDEKLNVGDYVRIKSLDMEGKITRLDGKRLTVVTHDGLSLNTDKDKCEKIATPVTYKPKVGNIDQNILGKKTIPLSINLIGYHIDEGLSALDKYLSDCYARGYKSVKIIHGYGSGQLRQAIHTHLKKFDIVKSFRLGDETDGGAGATTIVTLK